MQLLDALVQDGYLEVVGLAAWNKWRRDRSRQVSSGVVLFLRVSRRVVLRFHWSWQFVGASAHCQIEHLFEFFNVFCLIDPHDEIRNGVKVTSGLLALEGVLHLGLDLLDALDLVAELALAGSEKDLELLGTTLCIALDGILDAFGPVAESQRRESFPIVVARHGAGDDEASGGVAAERLLQNSRQLRVTIGDEHVLLGALGESVDDVAESRERLVDHFGLLESRSLGLRLLHFFRTSQIAAEELTLLLAARLRIFLKHLHQEY